MNSNKIGRREFMKMVGKYSAAFVVGGYLLDCQAFRPGQARADVTSSVFVSRNGTPAENVQKVIDMRYGGIERLIGPYDTVVISPNGQWEAQGGTNCACIMGLIDLILNLPGGFHGEIIFAECTQFIDAGYWTMNPVYRNGPYNFNDMIAHYRSNGHPNVSGVRIRRSTDDPAAWPVIAGPEAGQGWARPPWHSPTSSCDFSLAYPIIRSPFSGRYIDLKKGVYSGGYEGQPPLKFIKMPNLNNHGNNTQDYAGITSAVKSFLGITEIPDEQRFPDGSRTLHTFSDSCGARSAFDMGEAVGAWMRNVRKPDCFITTAEYVGWGSRTGTNCAQARTVGLADDPVSLDYYMAKHVMAPLDAGKLIGGYLDPDFDPAHNSTRRQLEGCMSQGFGAMSDATIASYVYDFNAPKVFRFDIDRMIQRYRAGEVSQQQVLDLIERYNQQ
jgi:hypothetical protein